MPQVNIVVNGHAYAVACDEGQEEHLGRLGDFIDGKVRDLVASAGQVGEARLILMAALVVADELADALAKLEARDENRAQLEQSSAAEREAWSASAERAAETLENAASRIEAIAVRLSSP